MNSCPNCGAELNEGARFCGKCGTAVLPTSSEDIPKTEEVEESKKEVKKGTSKKTRKTTAKKPRTQPVAKPKQEKVEAEVADGGKPAPGYYKWLIIGLAGLGLLVFFGNGGLSLSFWWWIVAILLAFLGGMAWDGDINTKDTANAGLFIAGLLCLFLSMCSGEGSNNSASSSESSQTTIKKEDKCPDWVYGFWKVNTPYGMCSAAFFEGGGYTDNIDKGSGTFYYDASEKMIHTSTGSRYEVDPVNHRIGIGEGYWMHRITN